MRKWPSLASLCVVCAVASPAPAQDRVPPSRALREMEVRGTAAFDRDQIARALVADEPTLRALQRGLDAAAAEVAERVEELHWRGGYADAKASGEVVRGRLRIALQAGSRYRCGEVRCTGNSALSTQRIRDALAEKQTEWVPGRFPRLGGTALRRAAAVVKDEYVRLGRHGVALEATFVPDGEVMMLDVAVADEGHEVRIQSLSLQGDDAEHRDAVLEAVQFTPGTLLTLDAIAALRRQFEQTGRYSSVRFDVPAEVPKALDPLQVVVKVRPRAQEIDRLAARDIAQLCSASELVFARLRQGVPLQVEWTITKAASWGRFQLLPGRVVIGISTDGLAATAEHVAVGGGPAVLAAAFFTPDELAIALGDRVGRWRFDQPVGVQFQFTSKFLESGGCDARWGIGVSRGGGGPMIAVDVHPGTAAYLLSQASEVRRDGDELEIRFGGTRMRLMAGGEFAGDRVDISEGDVAFSLALRGTPLAEQRRAWLPATVAGTASEASSILLDTIVAIVTGAMASAAQADARVQVLLRSSVGPIVLPASPALATEQEDVPKLGEGVASMDATFAMIASIPAVDRRFSGRLVDFSAAFAPLLRGDSRSASAAFANITANPDHGPLSLALVAVLLGACGNQRASASFSRAAVDRLGFAAFYADAADLGGNVPSLAAIPAQVGARWRAQPELRELFADVPAGESGDLAAWRKGLDLLWNAGGERLLRDVLLALDDAQSERAK